jgi:DNA-binding NarL/FixJ family response regulator
MPAPLPQVKPSSPVFDHNSQERPSTARHPPASQLTPREFQICELVAQGATNPEVAGKLFLSCKTIEAHLGRIYAKLGVRSRTELTRLIVQKALSEA